jgi:hypothetical protein
MVQRCDVPEERVKKNALVSSLKGNTGSETTIMSSNHFSGDSDSRQRQAEGERLGFV